MPHFFRISVLVSAWFFTASLWAKPVILSIGDSLTFGLGVAPEKTWPFLLENKLQKDGFPGAKVVNAGSSGATTAFGLSALQFHLKRGTPDLVVYALGANDGLRGLNPDASYKNVAAALELLKKRNIKVLVLGMKAPPNYGEKFPKDFAITFSKAATQFQVPLVPFFLEGVAGDPKLNQADGIHPNEKGYEKILDTIYPQVKALL